MNFIKKDNTLKNDKNLILDKNKEIIHNFRLPILCSTHNKQIKTLKGFLSHIIDTHKTYICEQCGENFKTFKRLKTHILSNINKDDAPIFNNEINEENLDEDMVKCSECGLIFNSVEKMSFHYFEVHEKNKKEKNDNKEWRRQTKPQVEKEVEKNNNKEKKNIELEERYSKWIEMRMGNKNDEAKKKKKKNLKD